MNCVDQFLPHSAKRVTSNLSSYGGTLENIINSFSVFRYWSEEIILTQKLNARKIISTYNCNMYKIVYIQHRLAFIIVIGEAGYLASCVLWFSCFYFYLSNKFKLYAFFLWCLSSTPCSYSCGFVIKWLIYIISTFWAFQKPRHNDININLWFSALYYLLITDLSLYVRGVNL